MNIKEELKKLGLKWYNGEITFEEWYKQTALLQKQIKSDDWRHQKAVDNGFIL